MSNLKLPVMNFGNLNRLISGKSQKTIAYMTTATGYETFVSVWHHGNFIGEVWQGGVYLNTAGYASQTTAQRLNAMLVDSLPQTPFRVSRRDFSICLTRTDDKKFRQYFRDVIVYDDGTIVLNDASGESLNVRKLVA